MTGPTTALLVIDPLRRFTEVGAPFEAADATATVARIDHAADAARAAGHRVVWTTRAMRPQVGPGQRTSARYGDVADAFTGRWAELDPRLGVQNDDVVIDKTRHSAFHATDLDQVLRTWEVQRVVIAGFTFNVCCLATAFDAVARDYDVVFARDLLGARGTEHDGTGYTGQEIHRLTQVLVAYGLGDVVDAAELGLGIEEPA